MKKYILSILLICNMTFAYSATSTTNDIYVLAQANSTSELSSVPDVNTTDSNGDTALCLAIKNKNTSAYNALKNAGADTNPKCIKSIPKDSYNSFMKTVADTGTTSKTFLGLGKWGWGLIGLGVAGGVGVAAMSGGGGGSDFVDNFTNCEEYDAFAASFGYKYSERGKCPDGYKDGGGQICQSYTCGCRYTCDPIVCGEDFWFECPTGFVPTGNTCKSGEITYKQCEPDTCDGYDYDTCPDGWLSESSCWSGFFTLKYKCDVPATCSFPYTETECTEGYIEYDTCKSGNTVYKQCILDREHYISQGDKIYPKLNCEHGTQVTNSCVCKEGWTGELCDTPVECPYNTQSCGTGYIETVYRCKSGDNTYVKCELDKKHYIEQDGVIYRKLDCQSGVQDKDTCICPDGMTGALCDKPVQCPYTTTACSYGYVESGNTCQSVNTIYKECIFDSANYIEQGGNIYPKLNCVHGSQEAHKCICENGWAGVSCNNPVDCPYTTVSCSAGFHETGHSCQSGETTYMECEPDSCDGYNYTDTSQCPNGYKVSDSCLS
ncbi:MAG: hypothetical protein IJ560_00770, partial [Alphaproteobacteria bacterium]|nr:hypothetical protein [Alphaproteobacteria bacterium]